MTLVNVTEKHSGKSEKQRLAEGEAILSDHINGMRASALMEKYGVSKATLYRRIDAAVAARVAPTVDAYREKMNAAYDEQLERCNQNIAACHALIEMVSVDPKAKPVDMASAIATHARAVELLNRTREAQRKLNGLDMPTQANVTVTVTTQFDQDIASLVDQLEMADAPAAG